MANRNLELNLRARADTSELERLSGEMDSLLGSMKRVGSQFGTMRDEAQRLATAFGGLTDVQAQEIEQQARLSVVLSQAATARERAAAAAQQAVAAESRAATAAEQAQQATIKTAVAQERLSQAQSASLGSVAKAAAAEEKLAQEREKTLQATSRTEKEEINLAKAREQLRAATARADKAEESRGRSSMDFAKSIAIATVGVATAADLAIAAGRKLMDFGRQSLEAASMVEESAAKFRTVFKDAAAGVEADLGRMAEANRRSVFDLMGFAATLQDTFVPLGFARDQAAGMSTQLTQLALDLAAFNNQSDSEVVTRLTSALVGNSEAVRSYGIIMTESVIKSELAAMGMDKLTGAALEQAKVQARLNIILRTTQDAQGAAVRESGSYANTIKAFEASVLDLKVSLGEGLLPMMTQLVDIATKAADIISGKQDDAIRAANATALEAAKSTGTVYELAKSQAADLQKQLETSYRAGSQTNPLVQSLDKTVVALSGSSSSAATYTERLKELGYGFAELTRLGRSLGLDLSTLGGTFEERSANIYRYARALQEAAGADQVLRQKGPLTLEVEAEVDTSALLNAESVVRSLGDNGSVSAGKFADGIGRVGDAIRDLDLSKLQEATSGWFDSFNAAPVDGVISAQKELDDLRARQASGEYIPQGDLDAAAQAVIAANDKIIMSYKQRALEALMAQAIEKGAFDSVGAIAQVAVNMGLMTQAEADMRSEFATTIGEMSKLTEAYKSMSLTQWEAGTTADALAAGIYATADAAIQARQNITATQDFWASGPSSSDLTAFYQSQGDPGRMAEVEINIAARLDEAALAEYETFRADLDEMSAGEYRAMIEAEKGKGVLDFETYRADMEAYDAATYEAQIAAAFGSTKSDVADLTTQLENMTRNPWVIRIQRIEEGGGVSGGSSGGGGGGGGGGGNQSDEATTQGGGSTVVVESIRVNNYAGVNAGEAARRGILEAFRSLG